MIRICFISFLIIFYCLSLRINIVPLANFENPKAAPPHLNSAACESAYGYQNTSDGGCLEVIACIFNRL
jgi:hypothetical protein